MKDADRWSRKEVDITNSDINMTLEQETQQDLLGLGASYASDCSDEGDDCANEIKYKDAALGAQTPSRLGALSGSGAGNGIPADNKVDADAESPSSKHECSTSQANPHTLAHEERLGTVVNIQQAFLHMPADQAQATGSALSQHAQASIPTASAAVMTPHDTPSDAAKEPAQNCQPTAAITLDVSEALAEPVAPGSHAASAVRAEQPASAVSPAVPDLPTGATAGSDVDTAMASNGLCQAKDAVTAESASVDMADTAHQLSSTHLISQALVDTGENAVTDAAAADAAGLSADTLADDAVNTNTAAATKQTAAGTADGLSTSAHLASATATEPYPQAATQPAASLDSNPPVEPKQVAQGPPAQTLSSQAAAQKQLAACVTSSPALKKAQVVQELPDQVLSSKSAAQKQLATCLPSPAALEMAQGMPAEILSSKEAAAYPESALPSASAGQQKVQPRSATVFMPPPGWAATAGSSVKPGKAAAAHAALGLSAADGIAPEAAENGSGVNSATLQAGVSVPVWHAKQRRSSRSARSNSGLAWSPGAEVPPTAADPLTAAASMPKGGAALKGQAIEIWWSEDKAYYPGVVKSFNGKTGLHGVWYEDGMKDKEDLSRKRYRLPDLSDTVFNPDAPSDTDSAESNNSGQDAGDDEQEEEPPSSSERRPPVADAAWFLPKQLLATRSSASDKAASGATASAGASLPAPAESTAKASAGAVQTAAVSRPRRTTRPPSKLNQMSATPLTVNADLSDTAGPVAADAVSARGMLTRRQSRAFSNNPEKSAQTQDISEGSQSRAVLNSPANGSVADAQPRAQPTNAPAPGAQPSADPVNAPVAADDLRAGPANAAASAAHTRADPGNGPTTGAAFNAEPMAAPGDGPAPDTQPRAGPAHAPASAAQPRAGPGNCPDIGVTLDAEPGGVPGAVPAPATSAPANAGHVATTVPVQRLAAGAASASHGHGPCPGAQARRQADGVQGQAHGAVAQQRPAVPSDRLDIDAELASIRRQMAAAVPNIPDPINRAALMKLHNMLPRRSGAAPAMVMNPSPDEEEGDSELSSSQSEADSESDSESGFESKSDPDSKGSDWTPNATAGLCTHSQTSAALSAPSRAQQAASDAHSHGRTQPRNASTPQGRRLQPPQSPALPSQAMRSASQLHAAPSSSPALPQQATRSAARQAAAFLKGKGIASSSAANQAQTSQPEHAARPSPQQAAALSKGKGIASASMADQISLELPKQAAAAAPVGAVVTTGWHRISASFGNSLALPDQAAAQSPALTDDKKRKGPAGPKPGMSTQSKQPSKRQKQGESGTNGTMLDPVVRVATNGPMAVATSSAGAAHNGSGRRAAANALEVPHQPLRQTALSPSKASLKPQSVMHGPRAGRSRPFRNATGPGTVANSPAAAANGPRAAADGPAPSANGPAELSLALIVRPEDVNSGPSSSGAVPRTSHPAAAAAASAADTGALALYPAGANALAVVPRAEGPPAHPWAECGDLCVAEMMPKMIMQTESFRVFRRSNPDGYEVCCLVPGCSVDDIRVSATEEGSLDIQAIPKSYSRHIFGAQDRHIRVQLQGRISTGSIRSKISEHGQLYVFVPSA